MDWKNTFYVYAGAYTARTSKGICLSRFDAMAGALGPFRLAAEMPNPTFVAIHPNRRFLYAVSELRDSTGRHGGSVNAFSIAPETGALTSLNRQSSQGAGPCHLSVDATGRVLLVANYASGSVAALPIAGDGRLGEASDKVQHHGSSVHPERQAGPHAHSITPSPDNRFALAADLGLDRIMIYRLDCAAGRLTPNDPPWASLPPGSGPRHLAFHPTLPRAYVVNELGNTVSALTWDAARGALQEEETISTLPPDFRGENFAADVHVHPSGRFLYASNRGDDTIAIFAIDRVNGLLDPIARQPTLGKWPRNFAIDPSGRWLLAANQEGDSVLVFRIEPSTGRLEPAGPAMEVSMPVCLKMVPCG